MDISVITLTWNSEKYIGDFLKSVISDIVEFDFEIIIIDNGSKDNTLNIVKEYRNQIGRNRLIFIPLPRNFGTTISRNIGLKIADGEYIFILDSDVEIIEKNTFKKMIEAFHKIPSSGKIGLIHPMLIYPDGRFQESARRFPSFLSKVARFLNLEDLRYKTESISGVIEKKVTPIEYAISAFWVIPKKVFNDVGYLDEKIFYAPEDAEFCARLWKNGYEVWYYPKVKVVHHAQRLSKRKPFSKLGWAHIKGLFYFWMKYPESFLNKAAFWKVKEK